MTVERVLKCLTAPVIWCIVIPVWALWFLLAFLFSPSSLRGMWLEFISILSQSVGN